MATGCVPEDVTHGVQAFLAQHLDEVGWPFPLISSRALKGRRLSLILHTLIYILGSFSRSS